MTDDTKAQACAAAFKPLAEMGKTTTGGLLPFRVAQRADGRFHVVNRSGIPVEDSGWRNEENAQNQANMMNMPDAVAVCRALDDAGFTSVSEIATLSAQLAAMREVLEAAKKVVLNGRGRTGGSVYMVNRDPWMSFKAALARAAALGVKP